VPTKSLLAIYFASVIGYRPPTSRLVVRRTFYLLNQLNFGRLLRFFTCYLDCQRTFELLSSAARRLRAEPCGPEKHLEGRERWS
jgi:hypothetical protein